jgi:hypothetical protein
VMCSGCKRTSQCMCNCDVLLHPERITRLRMQCRSLVMCSGIASARHHQDYAEDAAQVNTAHRPVAALRQVCFEPCPQLLPVVGLIAQYMHSRLRNFYIEIHVCAGMCVRQLLTKLLLQLLNTGCRCCCCSEGLDRACSHSLAASHPEGTQQGGSVSHRPQQTVLPSC